MVPPHLRSAEAYRYEGLTCWLLLLLLLPPFPRLDGAWGPWGPSHVPVARTGSSRRIMGVERIASTQPQWGAMWFELSAVVRLHTHKHVCVCVASGCRFVLSQVAISGQRALR